MRRDIAIVLFALVAVLVFVALSQWVPDLGILRQNSSAPEGEIAGGITPPEGFRIEVFAKDLPGARVIVGPDQLGNYWVSQPSKGVVSTIETTDDGGAENIYPVFRDLRKPHGLALNPSNSLMLYIAEEYQITRVLLYTDARREKIADLPAGGRHVTRTIAFGPDGKLYVSIGSSCDVCEENVDERAVIWRMNPDGSEREVFARGLRNAVFFDWDLVTGKMWATEMGRDFLGDDLPPDEINIVEEGFFYGWPWYYGKENVRDEKFMPNVMVSLAFPLRGAHIEIPAHSAPLGLAFVPEEGWPEDMALDLLVAYHGSWNRSEPTGYKLVRIDLDERTRESLGTTDFINGWLTSEGDVLGRPVDLHIFPGGTLFVTDDEAGVVYKVSYQQQ